MAVTAIWDIKGRVSEITDQATSTSENIQSHQFRIVLVFTKSLKNACNIFGSGISNSLQIFFFDICRTETEDTIYNCLINGSMMNSHDIFSNRKQA